MRKWLKKNKSTKFFLSSHRCISDVQDGSQMLRFIKDAILNDLLQIHFFHHRSVYLYSSLIVLTSSLFRHEISFALVLSCVCVCVYSKHSRRSVDSSMSEYYHQCLISISIVRHFFFFLSFSVCLLLFSRSFSSFLFICISSEYSRILSTV